MANALMKPSSGGWNPNDPSGWFNARGVDIMDLRAMKPLLEAQGQWNPAWDAALDDPSYYSSQQEGEAGITGAPASNALDLNALNGYQMAEQRNDGRTGTAAYFAPDGTMSGARTFERPGAMHGSDWRDMATVIGGVLASGAAIGGLAGGGAAGGRACL